MNKKEEICYCKRCKRKLKNKKAKELGFGKICFKKHLEQKSVNLF